MTSQLLQHHALLFHAAIAISAVAMFTLAVVVYAVCAVSGQCSREEEKRNRK